MTQPPASDGIWTRLRSQLSAAWRWVAGSGAKLWLGLAGAAVGVLALVVLANAMVTPATVAGKPTSTVTPLPVVTATPTPTASATVEPSASATPSASTKPAKTKASGDFDLATTEIPADSSSGELRTYVVRVETSLKPKANSVGKQIAAVLNDPRSWTGSGGVRFGLVAKAKKADFTISLAATATAAKSCKHDGSGACTDGAEVVIDASAWLSTPASFEGNSAEWQAYLVNHGLGELLGEKTAKCPKKAKPAPVMMVQSGDLDGCVANPWPYP